MNHAADSTKHTGGSAAPPGAAAVASGGWKAAIPLRPKVLDCLRGYTRQTFAHDASSGLTVGVLALPLAMAFAIASGVSPTAGIWTAIVAGFLIAALGGSRVQIGGPTGAFIPIVYGIVAAHGAHNLQVATMLAGFILLAMAVARLGTLIRYIPISVVIGFTNGIAVVIFVAQIKDFLGLKVASLPAEFFGKIEALFKHLDTLHLPTLGLSLASLLFLLSYNRLAQHLTWLRRAPGPLTVLVAGTLASFLLDLPELGVETIGTRFGGIPQDIPVPAFPHVSMDTLGKLISPAITIALLGAIESLLSARVADAQIDDKHDPNQELLGQGVANLIAPLFGGFAATGAIARTATNIRSGGRTPVAGMLHAAVLLLVVVLAAPLARHIPLATLSAIVVVVSINMGEWHEFRALGRYSLTYRTVLLSTFLITVMFDLTLAVEIGMVLASLFFIWRMQELTRVEPLHFDPSVFDDEDMPSLAGFRLHGSLFFGAAGKIEAALDPQSMHADVVVLDLHKVLNIDTTGLDALTALHRGLRKRGAALVIYGPGEQPLSLMRRSGFAQLLGEDNIVATQGAALDRARLLGAPGRRPQPA